MSNEKITFENVKGEGIYLDIDGEEAAVLNYALLSDNPTSPVYQIELVEVEEEFRGRGFYKMLLHAFFSFNTNAVLNSNDRNEKSNAIYRKWCDFSLEKEQEVNIILKDEAFIFQAIDEDGDFIFEKNV